MLVGRDTEVRAALSFLTIGALLVVGAPGAGTSALLREVAARRGGRVFSGGALAALPGMPHLAVERALRATLPADPARAADAAASVVGDGTLVVDDLSLAPDGTLALLEALGDRVALLCGARAGPAGTVVRARLAGAGFAVLDLGGLEPEAAVAMLRARGAPRADERLRAMARAGGGNPALLDALSRRAGDSPVLRLLLAERVAALSTPARQALGLLALLGRPARPALAGPGLGELVEAGAAVLTASGQAALRHPVLAGHAATALEADERRALHTRLAGLVEDPAEAARHHEAAGDGRAAHRAALAGAARSRTATDHARNLALAARTAGEPGAELRLLAARELADTLDLAGAIALAAPVAAAGGRHAARAELLLAIQRRGLRHHARAARHVERGIAAVREDDEDWLLPRLLLERACLRALAEAPGAAREARRAFAALQAMRAADPAAHLALAEALVVSRSPGSVRHARSARLAADRGGDAALGCSARMLEARALVAAGRPAQALALLRRAEGLAARVGEGPATTLLRASRAHLELHHRGDPGRALRIHEAMGAGASALPPALRMDHALALADVGRIAEADAVIRAGRQDDMTRAVRAQVDWLGGRADSAARGARRALAAGASGPAAESLRLTLAWACVDLGVPSDAEPGAGTPAGVRLQLEACALLAAPGREAEAEARFREARGALSGEAARHELRCAWAQGEAARRAGADDRALATLLEADARAWQHGAVVLHARVRRSLRQAGMGRRGHRSHRRGASGGLSPREGEVLLLVGQGLSSSQIAVRLGLARSTVDSQVGSARRKLGARSRIEAAVLVGADAVT